MDKIINKHIDSIEELNRQLDMIIEQEISQIDIDAVIKDPKAELAIVVDNIRRIFLDEYVDKAIELGFDLGKVIQKKIEQDKTLKIDDSQDPKLNDTGDNNKQD
ncbi:MAG: hypothetical protein PHY56_05395 [Candidatus Omnitrophica bacterium]|nr:hypothetical protein [Candidatus Omnitrophota bacterium]